MNRFFVSVGIFFMLSQTIVSSTPADLQSSDSVSIDGITWRFSEPEQVGRFINGDYYVLGSVTVTSISPAPSAGRNGSVKNLGIDPGVSGFDDRVSSNRFRENLRAQLPIALEPGDALISSISLDSIGQCEPWLREENETPASPVKSYSILTCLAEAVSENAFRPSYCDREQKIYTTENLKRELLSNLPKVENIPDINTWASHFRRPWLDVCFYGFDAAVEYQAVYGREVARATGMGTLMLNCNYTAEEKEPLLINIIQYGIDLWGIARAGYNGWQAHGGHGSGRKWPIIFAGMLLGDTAMASPNTTYPDLHFGEDMQTMYGECWTGANVVYAGHQGVIDGIRVSTTPGWGPYEHKHPSQWADSNMIGEDYRRCCTSISWVGEALAARIMNALELWNHPPFFDYVDRWMTENDSEAVATIQQERGWDYSAKWQRQGQCWDKFVQNMWTAYRDRLVKNKKGAALRQGGKTDKKSSSPTNKMIYKEETRLFDIHGRQIKTPAYKIPQGIFVVNAEGRYLLMNSVKNR